MTIARSILLLTYLANTFPNLENTVYVCIQGTQYVPEPLRLNYVPCCSTDYSFKTSWLWIKNGQLWNCNKPRTNLEICKQRGMLQVWVLQYVKRMSHNKDKSIKKCDSRIIVPDNLADICVSSPSLLPFKTDVTISLARARKLQNGRVAAWLVLSPAKPALQSKSVLQSTCPCCYLATVYNMVPQREQYTAPRTWK